ncbi:MAG: hypothetical protein ACE37B_12385 [Ilumatobacter sp.]|uniref:hypothetical protein n=1 Tax=Ilumatobacter sp. TaxID=1967498 RepID=UPI00391D4BAE
MGDSPDFRSAERDEPRRRADATPDEPLPPRSLQEIAHDRGRICKKRGCVVCAPLVEQRRLKKQQRIAAAQARAHEKGQPCGRRRCTLEVCVAGREAAAATSAADVDVLVAPESGPGAASRPVSRSVSGDPEWMSRRQAERHRVGLACGAHDCPREECVEGFANERTRRHRARRPCRSATCDNAICVAARSTN